MYVYICFDIEDPVNSDTDDVALDIATRMADEGILCSMLVVAEKARLWEQRGRTDVISAVSQHDLGLHTNLHSYHPNVSEYLEDKDWAGGVAEFVRREQAGMVDLERILGQFPSTWATSGYSWGPQIATATRQMGIPSHLYSFVKSAQTGATWFGGQLCYDDGIWLDGVEDAYCDNEHFERSLAKMLSALEERQRRGQVCSGVRAAHPTRFRYLDYWDEINFKRGKNTPPELYQSGQRRDDQSYAVGLNNLRRMALAVRDLPGVQLAPFRVLNQKFAIENQVVPWDCVREIAQSVIDHQELDVRDPLASPAQKLDLLARWLVRRVDNARPKYLFVRNVLGPLASPPELREPVTTDGKTAIAFCRELVRQVDLTGHLPTSLTVNGLTLGPGALLRGLAHIAASKDLSSIPEQVRWEPGPEEPAIAAEISSSLMELVPPWIPHKPDLRMDLLDLHTRLQCWTLKPARGTS